MNFISCYYNSKRIGQASVLYKTLFHVSFYLSSISLFSGIEDFFKKAEGKTDNHRMKNIDFIYMINLDQRPEKYQSAKKELEPYGINPYRFSAVNGWELSLEAINELGVKFNHGMIGSFWGTSYLLEDKGEPRHGLIENIGQTYFCHCMSKGAIGIVLSHLSILQDAYDSGYETIWVMEDDIAVLRDPNILSNMIEELNRLLGKRGWDVLFTDRDTKNQNGEYVECLTLAARPNFIPFNPKIYRYRFDINLNFRKIGARFGAYSMIVRRSGMKKILDFIKTNKIFLPYDMDNFLPPGIRLYTVQEDVVSTQLKAASDNGGPNYLRD